MTTARGGDAKDREPTGERRRRNRPQWTDESGGNAEGPRTRRRPQPEPEAEDRERRPLLPAAEAAKLAVRQVHELTGRQPEGVTSLEPSDEGWLVGVEVVESHRVPDTADILAVYEAELDQDGELVSYRRVDRYPRGRGNER